MTSHLSLALAVILLVLPASASRYDGIDNDGDDQIDEADEEPGGGNDMGRMERECIATGNVDVCMASQTMFCQGFGLPGPCALIAIGNNCYGGDPGQCRYYAQLMQANSACGYGDQQACAWLSQQPVAQTWIQ